MKTTSMQAPQPDKELSPALARAPGFVPVRLPTADHLEFRSETYSAEVRTQRGLNVHVDKHPPAIRV